MGIRKKIRKRKAISYSKKVKKGNKKKKTIIQVENKHYDKKATLKENYEKLGLQLNPNQKKNQKDKETEFLKDLMDQPVKQQKVNLYMALEEQQIVIQMQQKYKDDTEKMVKDRKLNIYFWNENQMLKKINQYQKLLDLTNQN